ncbi:DHA2 family efflux MFS transporter permease subunit [Burkholderia gladioli pv. gladioli]|uniref:Drug resistance MFS transporter, drug:H+ antiporter-2 family protein n=1 Tax=Burkholderia gladioli TaxID=28095 RepID=A0AAW3EZG8_BURGA|nr:DHA2 family efflux MFS transporter permease subunit [Burkholderia gladioli]AJW94093.1 drug resistance MFS transporter, drug:H+ antiporter-2 family protein [Burkholderia gladioli]ASD83413.1 EmrB/QacA family drug resistance transporter [Burkholderia gladioli pv. gladioli]AWY50840.1 EmrB/QacA family drug resistance transporter [Burkholderia gladioli pv. gladioli]KGC14169.1 drug resistance MFS transporter, drug:H+ antiporter-2 family protein [Burkholderia gladioli]MDJ1167025.1 DHA2 family efflu
MSGANVTADEGGKGNGKGGGNAKGKDNGNGGGDGQAWRPASNPWLIAIVVTLAAFMEVLDTTIVNVALPHIAGTMSASYDEATWTLTSYLVANGIVLPISGFLGRLLGRKRYFVICIAAFTVCSFLCGIATNLGQLIVFRILQGLFGGGLQPNQQSIILDTFPPEQRNRAFSISAIAIVVAPVLGPTLGGWITDTFSWRWVFLLNVPVGILTVLAVMQLVEDPPWRRDGQRGIRIDYIGIGLIAIGLGCLQVMLDRGEDEDWFGSNFIRIFAVLAVAGLTGAGLWLRYAKKPVVDLACLRDRNFLLGCITIAMFAAVLYGSAVIVPQLAQQQLGYTATLAGLVLSPGAILITLEIPIVSRLMPHVQTRYLVGTGFVLLAASLVYSRTLVPDIDYRHLMYIRCAQSMAIGFLFVPITTLAYLTIPQRLNDDASALFTMFRNVAGSIGISVSTALIRERAQARMAHLSEHMSPLSQNFQDALQRNAQSISALSGVPPSAALQTANGRLYETFVSQATILAYIDVFAILAVFCAACIPLTFLFTPAKAAGGGGGH